MKLKPSLKNLVKPARLFSILAILIFLHGCQNQIEPSYKEGNIPELVKKICKEEYSLDVTTQRTGETLWIYAPLPKILNKEYGIKEDKIFDEEMSEKFRNILTTIGRVLISSDKTPDFFALVASDINIGLDYTVIASILDIKKSYAQFIPWTEANKRYVLKFNINPLAMGDTTGAHLVVYNIKLPDFLAEQIAQRIAYRFQEEGLKKFFKIDKAEGRFENDTFIFEYSIAQTAKPNQAIDIRKEILKTITYCIQTYEFKSFSLVELIDLTTQNQLIISRAAIWGRSKD